jgi:NAD(P)-dependent dehydrogenase (short-subunit alcohol dehydrogenase family)
LIWRSLVRRIVADESAVQSVFDEGLAEFGRIDIVVANAGILPIVGEKAAPIRAWHDSVDIMLTGVLRTCQVAILYRAKTRHRVMTCRSCACLVAVRVLR